MTVMVCVVLVVIAGCLPALVQGLLPPVRGQELDGVPQAVVVPGGGRVRFRGHWRLSTRSLERVQAAIELARDRGLPLYLVGGGQRRGGPAEAALMATLVRRRAPDLTLHLETDSRNTWENARLGAALLHRHGLKRILLVTSASHLARATFCFRVQRLQVQPVASRPLAPSWVPSLAALSLVPEIYYEWLALIWYRLRHV